MLNKIVRPICLSRFANYKLLGVRQIAAIQPESHIIRSTLPDTEIPNLTVPEFLFQNWSRFSNRVALECGITGKKFTFDQIRRKSINLSVSLRKKLKLKQSDVLGILLPNTPEYPICILGALQAGMVVTTLTPLYSVDEISRHLQLTEVKAVVTIPQLLPLLQGCRKDIKIMAVKSKLTDSLPDGIISFNELIDDFQEADALHIDTNDVAIMPSSSGTTGFPKAVELTHKNIIANVLAICNRDDIRQIMISTEDYQAVNVGILPFFHVGGLIPLLVSSLWRMCKIVTLPKFHPETYISTLINHKPHYLLIVPYIASLVATANSIKKEYFDGVQMVVSSAAPMSILDEERLIEKMGNHVDVLQGYGATEATSLVTLRNRRLTADKNCGTVGQPLQNVLLKVVDEQGNALGPNDSGEILIKGPQLMKGYHNNPQQTEDTFIDGWLRSGDVGYYNEENMFFITDRIKELIKVKGYQVSPAEIESIIREHPSVLEAAVVGVPDTKYGEVPKAFVVLKENEKVNADKIQEFVATKVAKYKQLTGGVVFVDSLPKAPSGKVIRRKVKSMFENLET